MEALNLDQTLPTKAEHTPGTKAYEVREKWESLDAPSSRQHVIAFVQLVRNRVTKVQLRATLKARDEGAGQFETA